MSTAHETSNKPTIRHFCDGVNTGEIELVSNTVDKLMERDALVRTPLPIEATGAEIVKEVFARLLRAYPDLHITIEDLIEEGDRVVFSQHRHRNSPRRVHGHPANGQVRHVQRDPHRPVR
jgi:predicted ester cyclase